MSQPTLYLIPVPLSDTPLSDVLPEGNLQVIRRLRYFVVETLREARRFLRRCDSAMPIDDITFFEINEHSRPEDIPPCLAPLAQGYDMGVISDAGCPAVADPGADVVAAAQAAGYRVMPLVGPSSILLGLMASGFNGQQFAFRGYLPAKGEQRTRALKTLVQRIRRDRETQIFIETPYRNNAMMSDLLQTLPATMRLCVATDLTGKEQSAVTRTIAQWRERGDVTLPKLPTIFLLYE